ncbi:enoyl-CoA hydratase/isomerase family protein [bacterium]|nr:enoyl-CoA hydratase/isomerase family protein [bacterium]
MDFVKIEHRNRFVRITLSNPEKLNVLSRPVLEELSQVLERIESNPAYLVAVLTGEGKAFAAGADISEMQRFSPDEARDFARYGQKVLSRIEASRIVTIAAVNGWTPKRLIRMAW